MVDIASFCGRCGNATTDGEDRYCRKCGTALATPPPDRTPVAPTEANTLTVDRPEEPTQPAALPGMPTKCRVVTTGERKGRCVDSGFVVGHDGLCGRCDRYVRPPKDTFPAARRRANEASAPGYFGSPTGRRQSTNGLAIASMVLGIVWIYWIGSILALVFGYIARRQIAESNGRESGDGMATAGIVLGWIGVGVLTVLIVIAIIAR